MRKVCFEVTEWFSEFVDPIRDGLYETTLGFAFYGKHPACPYSTWWLWSGCHLDFMPGCLPYGTMWRGIAK